MIRARCRTNLDDYNCSRITVFAELPRIGDGVNVLKKGTPARLKVCSITHDIDEAGSPFIIVELHN